MQLSRTRVPDTRPPVTDAPKCGDGARPLPTAANLRHSRWRHRRQEPIQGCMLMRRTSRPSLRRGASVLSNGHAEVGGGRAIYRWRLTALLGEGAGRPRPRLAQSTQARMHPSNACASTIAKAYAREHPPHPPRMRNLGLFRCIIRVSQGRVEQKVLLLVGGWEKGATCQATALRLLFDLKCMHPSSPAVVVPPPEWRTAVQ